MGRSQVVGLRKWSPGSPDGERGASAYLQLDDTNMAEFIEERLVTTTTGVQEAASYHVSGPEQGFVVEAGIDRSLLREVRTTLSPAQRRAQPVPGQLVISSGEYYPEDEQARDITLIDECLHQ